MAIETDDVRGKSVTRILDQEQQIARALVAPDGTVSIAQNEAALSAVDVADVDLLLSFADKTYVIIPNGALDAISEANHAVVFADNRSSLADLFKMVGISNHAKAGSLRVVSGNVDAPKTLEEEVDTPKPQGYAPVAANELALDDILISPAPIVKGNGIALSGKGPGLGASGSIDQIVDTPDPVVPQVTPRPSVYRAGTKAPEIPPAITLDPNITADNIINIAEFHGTVAITGTAGGNVLAGDTVTLTINGVNYTGQVETNMTFSIDVAGSDLVNDPDHSIDASVTTSTGTATDSGRYGVDVKAPAAPVVALVTDSGISGSDLLTNNGSLALTGVESDATVQYSVDGGTTWSSSFTAVEGLNSVDVRQTDAAGNSSAASSLTFTLDTVAPLAPTVALAVDSGMSSSDLVTNNGTLALTGIESGSTVEYSTNGGTTWTSSFTAVEGLNSVDIRQTDAAGNSSGVSNLTFTLDTTVAAPTVALTSDSGSSNSDHITNVGTLVLTGVEAGATVEYSIDNGLSWSSTFTAAEGLNSVDVRQTDVAGNTSSVSNLTFTLDTTAPPAPVVALASDSGASSSDLITNGGSLALTGIEAGASVEYSINGGTTWSSSFTAVEGLNSVEVRQTDVAGNSSAASSLTFTLDTTAPVAPTVALATDSGVSSSDLVTNVGTLALSGVESGATVEYSINGGSTWSSSFTAVEGINSVEVRQTDVAGNTSSVSSLTFTVDTVVPAAPTAALAMDSGINSSDLLTNVGTLTLTGIESGATVEYSIDGGLSWSSSFTAVEGLNSVDVRQTDLAGNTSSASSLSFTLDTTAPVAPTVALTTDSGTSSSDLITNAGTLALSGVEAGASVEYSINGGASWSSSFTAVEGLNSVEVRQTDLAGNTSSESNLTFTLDTAVAAPTVALTTDSGMSASDLLTNVGTLSLTGVEAGASVEYSVNGGTTWTSSFTAVEGLNSVEVRQTDLAGNTSSASNLTFTLDTTPPPTPIVTLTSDSGANSSDHITNVGTLALTGIESGATVEYSINGGASWSSSFTPVEGANSVDVRQTDIAGNTSSVGSLSFTLDTTAPLAPTVALAIDSGTSNSDLLTNVGTLALTGIEAGASVEYSLDGGLSWTSTFTAIEGLNSVDVRQIDLAGNTSAASSLSFTLDTVVPLAPTVALTTDSGTSASDLVTNVGTLNLTGIEAGASVEYSINGGSSWSSSFTAVEGLNSVDVRQTDLAGNVSSASSLTFTLDTGAVAPGVTLATDSGASASDLVTNVASLNLTGIEAGATVEYSTNGGSSWSSSFTAVEGLNSVDVRQIDVAGNTSAASNLTFTLDTTVPAAPIVALATDSGTSASDLVTNVGSLNLTGIEAGASVEYSINGGLSWSSSFTAVEGLNIVEVRQTDVAGNTSSVSNLTFTLDTTVPTTPIVALVNDSGTNASDLVTNLGSLNLTGIEAGATVEYSTNGGSSWSSIFTAVEGVNSVDVRQIDVAGNVSSASSLSFTLDTVAPIAPSVALASDSGASASDLVTNLGTLNLTGIEAGATVEYSTNGGSSWSSIFTAVEGVNSVDVRQIDVAGNTSAASNLTFTLDTTVPAAPIVELATDSGTSASDLVTNVGSLNLTGIEAGASVEYSIDNGLSWSSSFTAVEGLNNVEVRQIDVAGNTSAASNLTFTLDTTVPAAPTAALATDSGASSSDLITNVGSLNLTGVEAGASVEYSINGGLSWSSSFTAVEGLNSVDVRQIDVAGNTSSVSSLSFTLDTTLPVAPGVALATDSGTNASDLVTNVGSLNLTGVEAGASVEYSIDGGSSWSSSFTAVEGVNSVDVRQVDVAGNTSAASSLTFTLDTTVPAVPIVALATDSGASATDLVTNVGSLNLTGIEVGASVEYSIDNGLNWSSSFTAVEGANSVDVRQIDVAGNTSAASSLSFTLDTTAPVAPTVALATDSGTSPSDLVTNVGTLALTGIEAGASVEYSIDGGLSWSSSFTAVEGLNSVDVRQTDVAGNTSSVSSLSFTLDTTLPVAPGVALATDSGTSASDLVTNVGSLNLTGIEAGASVEYSTNGGSSWSSSFTAVEGLNSVEVRQIDVAGNTSSVSSLSFTLDTAVVAPTVTLTSDSGVSASDLVTNVGSLNLTGIESGASVEYSIDNGLSWSSSFTAVEGLNSVEVRQTDVAGNTSSVSSLTFTLDTVVPLAPTVALATDSGTSASDLVTNVGTLNLAGIEAGASVEYSINGGTTWTSSFTAVEGLNSVDVRQTDVAGNTGSVSSLTFTLDTGAAAPGVALATDSGISSSDLITNVGTLNLAGIEAGASVEYSVNGGSSWSSSFTAVEGLNSVDVRQIDIAGNTSSVSNLTFTLDTGAAAPGVALATDSGASNSDLITNVGTLALTGIESGASVEYSTNNGLSWSSSFTAAEGLNSVDVRQTDVAGNISSATSLSFTLDTAAPTALSVALSSDTGASNSDHVTSVGTLALTGTEAGASVEYSINGGSSWSSSFIASEGANSVQIRQVDVAGNASSVTSLNFVLDTAAPLKPVIAAITDDTGLAGDHLTSDKTLIFSGSAEANSSVEVFVDGVSRGMTTADAAGAWSFDYTGTTLAVGTTYNVTATAQDAAGNTSALSSVYAVTIDAASPVPVINIAPTITADNIINIAEGSGIVAITGTVSGDAKVGDTVTLTVNGVESTGLVQAGKTFSINVAGADLVADGDSKIDASITTYSSGIPGTATTTRSYTVDVTAPVPTIALAANITADNTINIAEGSGAVAITGTVGGDAHAGDTVTLTVNGVNSTGQVRADNSFSIYVAGSDLAADSDNKIDASITTTDAAGNPGTAAVLKGYSVDVVAPAVPTVALATDSGSSNSDHVTNVGTLALTGIEAGASVEYSVNGGLNWSSSFTAVEGTNSVQVRQTDVAGNTGSSGSLSFTLDTTVAAPIVALASDSGASNSDHITNNGSLTLTGIETGASVEYSINGGSSWSSSFTAVEGLNSVDVRQTDAAGNTSSVSSVTFTLDTNAPTAPGVALATDSGASSSDLVTNAGSLTLTGIEAGATVEYSINGGSSWSSSFTAVEGLNSVEIRQTDVAGNTSSVSSLSFTLDTVAPLAPTVNLASDSGASSSDLVTNVGSLALTGVEAGGTVEYSTNGGSSWSSSFTAVEGLNSVEVRQTDVAGNTGSVSSLSFILDTTVVAPGVALASDSGSSNSDLITNAATLALTGIEAGASVEYSINGGSSWSSSFTAVEGLNSVEIRQTDVAGNTSGVSNLTFTLDTTVAAPGVALATDSGASSSDLVTNAGSLVLTGVEAGSTVEYSINGGSSWSSSFTAVEGLNSVQVRQTDVAGNTSSPSSLSFTLDTVAPLAPSVALASDSGVSNSDLITNAGSLALTGVEAGATVEYSTNGGSSWSSSFTAVEGLNSVEIRQTDVAGNTGSVSSLSFTLDTTAPAAPAVALTSDSGASSSDLVTNVGTLALSGIEAGAKVEYSINGGLSWSSSFTAVEGLNSVEVRQTDVAGNSSSVSNLAFTLDTTVPVMPTVALASDSGPGSSDHITNTGTLTLTGIEAGATVEYSINGGTTWNSGFTAAEGSNSVQVRQTDAAGNTSSSGSLNFTLDTVAPAAPTVALSSDTGASGSDLITRIGTLALSGIEAGATVEYSTNGGTTWSSSFTAVEGNNSVQVHQTDMAGNTSSAVSLGFTLDTVVPAAPTVALTSDSGASNSDHVTNVATLALSGIEAGATVEYSTNGGLSWNSSFTAAEGSNSVQVRQTDVAGNVSGGTLFNFTLDTAAPAKPSVTAISTDSGVVGDHLTNDQTLVYSGTAEANSTVQVFVNGTSIGFTVADGSGAWSFDNTATTLSNATYSVTAVATDAAGNTSVTSDPYSVTIETSVAKPSVTAISNDSGVIGDHITSDQTLIFSGSAEASSTVEVFVNGVSAGSTIADGSGAWSFDNSATSLNNGSIYNVTATATDAAGNTSVLSDAYHIIIDTAAPSKPSVSAISIDSGVVGDHLTNDQTLTFSGTAEANSSVEVFVNGVSVGTTSANGAGLWTFDNSATVLTNGATYSVTATATDAAGNTSTVADGYNVTIDATAGAPGVALASDTGASSSDHVTRVGTLSLSGVEAGATVEYSINGGATWTSSFTAVEGSNSVQVRQTDVAGNTSSSGSLTFTLDTIAPGAPTVALSSDSGASSSDLITRIGTLTLGGVETGATVQYSTNGGTTWSNSFVAAEGNNNIQVRQIDVAGNTSSSGSLTFTLDTTVAAPVVALVSDTGASSSDHITRTGILTLGGIETGATVEYSVNGGSTWSSSFTAAEGNNSVLVRQTDVAGNTNSGSLNFTLDTVAPTAPTVVLTSDSGASNSDLITRIGTLAVTGVETGATLQYSTNGGLTWSNSFTAVEGSNSVQVRQVDVAGNASSGSSFAFTLDTSLPAAPTVALASDSGSSSSDHITNSGALTVTGIEAGATVEYSTNGGLSWSSSFTAVEGNNSVQVHQIDVAGNTSSAGSLNFTLDTVTPSAPTATLTSDSGASSSDHMTNVGTLALSGVEAGATVEYSINNGLSWTSTFTAVEGINNVDVRQTDVAGNTSSSSSFSFTYDTTAPTPSISLAAISGDNVIGIPELRGNVAISGTVGGDAHSGDTVTLTVNGTSYTGIVDGGNSFSIAVAGSDLIADADKKIDASVSTTDSAGNVGTVTTTAGYSLDNTLSGTAADDTLIGNSVANTLIGLAGNDTLEGMGGADNLIGGSGSDTATYGDATAGVTASLTVSLAALQTGDAAGDTFTSIENLTGSSHNDILIGNNSANLLNGGLGDDILEGMGGADSLIGGGGSNTASYEHATTGVTASLATPGVNSGDAAGDSYTNILNLTGSAHGDILSGDGNANILSGGAGADALDGGGGTDTASYASALTGVFASLTASYAALQTGDAVGDTFTNIENLTGSAFSDTLLGDSGANLLNGGLGDDTLEGMGGADILIGGGGNDTASYEHASGPVHASLAAPGTNSGDAAGDSYVDIHNLTGSAFADTLSGDGSDNVLIGGAGADILDGGAGNDTASYANAANGVFASLTKIYAPFQSGDAAGDTYNNIENLTGSGQNDTLIGDGGANILTGGDGNDVLEGRGGDDTIHGGGGNDTIYANQGHDAVHGGDNNDTVYVSSLPENLPTVIDGGARDAGNVQDHGGNVLVVQDLVNNGSYNLTTLANVTDNIDTLDISGDGAKTALTVSSLDVQHMVNNGSASQLFIKADSGDTLNISLNSAAGETMTPLVVDATHTDYTIFNASHVQIAQDPLAHRLSALSVLPVGHTSTGAQRQQIFNLVKRPA